MQRPLKRFKRRGQALVEFAMISLLLIFILGMAIDGGLMYLTYQNMVNAVEEGLAYGTYEPMVPGAGGAPTANDAAIRFRMRHEGGDRDSGDAGINFINLFDLNTNGTLDDAEGGYAGGVLASHIIISGHTTSTGSGACASRAKNCWLRIEMTYDYRTKFPILPVFSDPMVIRVVRFQQIVH